MKPVLILLVSVMVVAGLPAPNGTQVPILEPPEDVTEVDLDVIVVDPDETPTTLSPENNESEAEFEPSDCFLPKGRGPCRAIIEQFFFNTATKSCEVFGWSGCGGNKNRFATKDACELNCRQPTVPVEQPSLTTAEVMPSTKAPLMTKHKLPTCPTFTGCGPKCVIIQDRSDMGCKRCLCGAGGPDKRYTQDIPAAVIVSSGMNVTITKTSEVSIGSVSGVPMDIDEEEDVPIAGDASENCKLPKSRGNCRGMVTRYRYDPVIKDCVQFHYGGCEGNLNNFVTKAKCLDYCRGQ